MYTEMTFEDILTVIKDTISCYLDAAKSGLRIINSHLSKEQKNPIGNPLGARNVDI